MAANILLDEGKIESLDESTGNLPLQPLICDLYKDLLVITPGMTLTDFTIADFGGYVPNQPLTGLTPSVLVGSRAQTIGTSLQWQHDSGVSVNSIGGMLVWNPATSKVRWVAPRVSLLIVSLPFQLVSVLPVYTRGSEF